MPYLRGRAHRRTLPMPAKTSLRQPQRCNAISQTEMLLQHHQTRVIQSKKRIYPATKVELSNYIQGLPDYIRKQLTECKEKLYQFID